MRQEQLWTTTQVAQRLGVSRFTVIAWVKAGKVDSVQVGRYRLIPESEVRRLERMPDRRNR